jgi:sortase A
VFKSLKVSVVLVLVALLGLAALPAYPQTETASVELRPAKVENAATLLGENLSGGGEIADPSRKASEGAAGRSSGALSLSVPRLGLEDVPVPTGDSQEDLDREGVIRMKETGRPSEEGSNTAIVGHRLGFMHTKIPYVFYELDKLKPGDEVSLEDGRGKKYTFRVYDLLTVRPEDYWVTRPVPGRTIVSLQTCVPIPTFEKRLIVRAELVG